MVCSKCGGRGWYAYDENHAKPCEVCCRHERGVWLLEEYYGQDNGKWCCLAGCGALWNTKDNYERGNKPL